MGGVGVCFAGLCATGELVKVKLRSFPCPCCGGGFSGLFVLFFAKAIREAGYCSCYLRTK